MYSDNKLIRSTTSSRRLVSLTNEVTLHENQHHCVGTLKIRCPGPKTMSSVQNPGGLIYIREYAVLPTSIGILTSQSMIPDPYTQQPAAFHEMPRGF